MRTTPPLSHRPRQRKTPSWLFAKLIVDSIVSKRFCQLPGTFGDLRPLISLLATAEPKSGEGLRSEGTPQGPPSSPQDREPQDLMYGETAARSFVKALVWRITAAAITLVSVTKKWGQKKMQNMGYD